MANTYEPLAVANYFIERAKEAGRPLTQMQLYKLIYFAHGWSLGIFGKPLINESVEAWKYGPVVRSLYHRLKEFGSGPIPYPIPNSNPFMEYEDVSVPVGDAETRGLLDKVWQVYGKLSAAKLSQMSHEVGGPWDIAYKETDGEKYTVIPDRDIQVFFEGKANSNAAKRTEQAHPNT